MDIQQWEKESLAAYVHRFKMAAKRCNFTNDATAIRIFIKGLKNAHSLATHIYEKGPQMLTDAISELEKFNAAKQHTAMIIPPSTFNVMSNEEDCCSQCQEFSAMNAINMVMSSWTAHTRYLLQELQQLTTNLMGITMPDWVQDTIMKTETGKADPDHNPTTKDITAWAIAIHIEATPDHYIGTGAITTGVAHDDLAQFTQATTTTIDLTTRHHTDHIAVLHNIKALQDTDPEIKEGHIHDHLTDHQGMNHVDQVHDPAW